MSGPAKILVAYVVFGIGMGALGTVLLQYLHKHVTISVTYDHQHDFH